ncbi:MAG: hypothetical protein J0H43_14365 [Actinobacteria bacterium]|nr:hypothetical protein [Actinomycetota bacterium]
MSVVNEPLESDVPALRSANLACGQLVAGQILTWREHLHRKVEAIALLEGDRARRRISLDLTPLDIPWPPRRTRTRVARRASRQDRYASGQIVTPLTFIAKGLMRSLDVTDGTGRSLPVLGRRDNGELATAALEAVVTAHTRHAPDLAQWRTLHRIACGNPDEATPLAEALIADLALELLAANFVRDLTANFLLCVLLPRSVAGTRQVVKFSYHWEDVSAAELHADPRRLTRTSAGLGFGPFPIQIALGSPTSAASYHLEVPVPDGLICTSLVLPTGSGGLHTDWTVTPFGHAYDSYDTDTATPAEARLEVSSHGLLPTVTLAAIATFAIFAFSIGLPNALGTLRGSAGGANGLLLFGPALLLALITGRGENTLVSKLLLPLRAVSVGLSGLLFIAGASLVGQLRHPWITSLWWVCAVLSGGSAIVTVIATVKLRRRGG